VFPVSALEWDVMGWNGIGWILFFSVSAAVRILPSFAVPVSLGGHLMVGKGMVKRGSRY